MPFRRKPHRVRDTHRFGLTTAGWVFFLLMSLIMLAAFSSGHNLLYLSVCLFFGAFIVMGNAAVTNLRGLEVEREEVGLVFAETPLPVQIIVRNPRRIMDSFSLEVREAGSGNEKIGKVFFPLVRKGKESRRAYQLIAPRRGWFDLTRLEIVTRFPFGFWERSRMVHSPQRLLVYPRLFERWPERPSNLAVDGEYIGKKLGTGDDLLNFRDFQAGDPTRWIHWKNSAKTGKLTVAVFHHPENQQIIVCLRTKYPDRSNPTLLHHFEEAVSWAATAVVRLIDQGVSVGYADEDARITPSLGEGHKILILTHLALIEPRWRTTDAGIGAPDIPGASEDLIQIESTETGVRIVTGTNRRVFEETVDG